MLVYKILSFVERDRNKFLPKYDVENGLSDGVQSFILV
jgi:hypothetical protein